MVAWWWLVLGGAVKPADHHADRGAGEDDAAGALFRGMKRRIAKRTAEVTDPSAGSTAPRRPAPRICAGRRGSIRATPYPTIT